VVACPLQYLATSQHAEHASPFAYLDPVDISIPIQHDHGDLSEASIHHGYGWRAINRSAPAAKRRQDWSVVDSHRVALLLRFQLVQKSGPTENTGHCQHWNQARSDISSTTTPVNNVAPRLTLLPAAVLTASYSPFFRLLHLPRPRAYTNAIALIARTLNIIGAKILATYNHRL
jgi:hypothetical protein